MRWILVVLVVLILVGVWVLAVVVPDLRWFAEVLTATIVVPATLIVVGLWLHDRVKRARAEQAAKPANASDQTLASLSELRSRLRKDFAELHRIVGGRSARTLPRYLVLATPSSDSPTMLDALGLSRVSGSASSSSPAIERPQARYDLWSSRQAVIVTQGGSLGGVEPVVEKGVERDRWLALLEELRRLRPRPIDGVLLTVSAAELLSGDAAKDGLGRKLGAQLSDVLERHQWVVPAYLVVTKANELPGFGDFWSGFSQPDDVTWGASLSLDDDRAVHEPGRAVERELEILAQGLHQRVLERLPDESDPLARLRVLRFPLEFRSLLSPVTQFVTEVCRPGPGAERFVFRGFYFVAVSAETVPQATEAKRGDRRVPAPPGRGKPYFLTDLFRSVILPDHDLARRSSTALRSFSRKDLRTSLVALGVSFAVLGPALVSYVRNVDLAAAVEGAGKMLASPDPSSVPGTRGDPIEPSLDTLNRCEAEATSLLIPGWIGPRAARDLQAPLRAAYVARLHAWIPRRLHQELDRRLDAVASGGLADAPSAVDDQTPLLQAYEAVKLFATLADPKGHAESDWAAAHLAALWRAVIPDADAVPESRLAEHSRNYLTALATNPSMAWPVDHAFLTARERLRRSDVRGIPYRRVLLAAGDVPAVRASATFSPGVLEFLASRGDVQVPGAFTLLGWQKIRDVLRSSAPLPQTAAVERWVLDDPSLPQDDPGLRRQVIQMYLDEYVRRWMSFLDEVKVKTPADVAMARAELSAFKEGDGFYKTLFELFKQNTIRDDQDALAAADGGVLGLLAGGDGGLLGLLPWFRGETDAGAKAAGPSRVEKSFRPILLFSGAAGADSGSGGALSKYLAILDKLQAALEAPAAPKANGQDAQSPFTEASTGAAALLDGVEEPTRGRLWRLLMPPVMGGVQAAKAEGVSSLSDDWKSSVWTAWDQKLKDRYPFARAARASPASFADFATFFRPDGVLWTFVHARLADWVEERGDGRYLPKPGTDALEGDALACLTVAQEITDAFFNSGEEPGLKLSMQADWNAPDVSNAKFSVGAKETALPKGQWAGPIRWFGEDVHVEWQQQGRPTQELGRHSFSFFDLFDHLGGLKPIEAGRSLYASECPPLTLKLRPEGRADPLRGDFFARLHCPEELRVEKR
ncbi:MAG TPA: type VI secretion protein IcmF/TssM N-terminal domain-containing protein [Polyangiaceae bacterium]|nr:type VI secretion protein IcmF/TssM N-terminal domain-containing protein [Polyangiaceae bacterium]